MRKLLIIAASIVALAVPTAALPAAPGEVSNAHGKSVNNTNANPNACWGQDRSFYASEQFFGGNMDIKQSFPHRWATAACSAPRGSPLLHRLIHRT